MVDDRELLINEDIKEGIKKLLEHFFKSFFYLQNTQNLLK